MTARESPNLAASVAPTRLTQDWFRVERLRPGVFVIEEPLHEERVKFHLVVGRERAVVIDTGTGVGDCAAVIGELTDRPLVVLTSHAHWDHIGGHRRFVGRAEFAAHPLDVETLAAGVPNHRLRQHFKPDRLLGPLPPGFDLDAIAWPPLPPGRLLSGGETIELGGMALEVIHAPGHSPGLLVLFDREAGVLFSTDAAYAGELYAQLPGSDVGAYRGTMARLAAMVPSVRAVYPAHGEQEIDPTLLLRMAAGFNDVAAGRPADEHGDGIGRHRFLGFSILVGERRATLETT